ncbi:Ger(x)C family spore germination protein [Neobacillus sp. OS1-33]|jgi:Ger(x)C family germination protein|uniref:Ger(x)C family spore germination protein n=1 Tax=Neobacillus sp. OS1-33 TaxID=3070683 RepID=UPI0027DF7C0F|nr:Ger(x)C family spore germination protein [Neobacillus sp. OS1-33]WML27200.1 Ger(x)C family spore germination protein [Neobacillus sp. OS1-33]
MKKAAIGILSLLLLTGCWDRLLLRNLQLVDIAGLDLDKESGDVKLSIIVTKLKNSGQGEGEPNLQMTEIREPSLIEAVGQGDYTDRSPFLGINTRIYMISKRFAAQNPVSTLTFLLNTPYSSVNTPVIVFDGNVSKLLKTQSENNKDFTKNLNEFILSSERNGMMPTVSMMRFILSREEPLEGIALPVLKKFNSGMELSGALLFRQGKNTGVSLSKEQVQMSMLLLGKGKGRQRYTGQMSENGEGRHIEYGFSVKKGNSKISVHPESRGLPKVTIGVRLRINVFGLGKSVHMLKADYVNRMEKELSKHLEEKAAAMIETLQKANCDILGIGMELKAYHPNIWKSLNWRKDFPDMSIEPNFDVQILNSEE